MKSSLPALLLALCAAAGCTDNPSTQVLTGRVTTSGALAVRAVSNGNVVTAARVRSDGSFTLSLPAGAQYRLEVLTSSGVQHVLGASSSALAFRVCQPVDPFDLGGLGHGHGGGSGGCMPPPMCDPSSGSACPPPPPPMCDPSSGSACPPPPPMCDPTTDPSCPPPPPPMCDPSSGSACPPPPPPMCDPSTGPCPPPPMCDPSTGPCPPPPMCTDPAGNCPPPPDCDPSTGMGCPPPPCDPMTQADCPAPPPPCMDPTDPQTCQDPCMGDPMQCGCDPSGSAASCWPPPPPCDAAGNCGSGMVPDHPPGDLGCGA